MSRSEFPVSVRKQAKERAGDNCEDCGSVFSASNPVNYDHDLPDNLGGGNSLENCVVLCLACHKLKTKTEDRPRIDKANRLRNKALGLTEAKPKWPSRTFSGEVKWNR